MRRARAHTHTQRACARNIALYSRPKRGGAFDAAKGDRTRHARTIGVVVSVLFARAHEGLGVVARPGLLVGMHVCRWLPLQRLPITDAINFDGQ